LLHYSLQAAAMLYKLLTCFTLYNFDAIISAFHRYSPCIFIQEVENDALQAADMLYFA